MYASKLFIMTPKTYKLWTLTDRNYYVSPDADKDFTEHFRLEEGQVYSLYTLTNTLLTDRDFAELYGVDMTLDSTIERGLEKLSLHSCGCQYHSVTTKLPNGEDAVVVFFDEY